MPSRRAQHWMPVSAYSCYRWPWLWNNEELAGNPCDSGSLRGCLPLHQTPSLDRHLRRSLDLLVHVIRYHPSYVAKAVALFNQTPVLHCFNALAVLPHEVVRPCATLQDSWRIQCPHLLDDLVTATWGRPTVHYPRTCCRVL